MTSIKSFKSNKINNIKGFTMLCKKTILISLIFNICALLSFTAAAQEPVIVECSSCNTEQQFRNFASSYMSSAASGIWDVTIVNTSGNTQIWNLKVEVVSYPNSFGQGSTYVLSSSRESLSVEKELADFVKRMRKPIKVDLSEASGAENVLSQCPTASYTQCGELSVYLRGLPTSTRYFQKSVAKTIWVRIFGTNTPLQFFIIFPDGTSILVEAQLGGEVSPRIAFSAVPGSKLNNTSTSGDDGFFYKSVPSGGVLYAVTPIGSNSCEVWIYITRVNGSITNVDARCE